MRGAFNWVLLTGGAEGGSGGGGRLSDFSISYTSPAARISPGGLGLPYRVGLLTNVAQNGW